MEGRRGEYDKHVPVMPTLQLSKWHGQVCTGEEGDAQLRSWVGNRRRGDRAVTQCWVPKGLSPAPTDGRCSKNNFWFDSQKGGCAAQKLGFGAGGRGWRPQHGRWGAASGRAADTVHGPGTG